MVIENDRSSHINQQNSIQITTNGNGNNHNGSQEIGSEQLKMVQDNENELDTSLLQGNNHLYPVFDFDDFSDFW